MIAVRLSAQCGRAGQSGGRLRSFARYPTLDAFRGRGRGRGRGAATPAFLQAQGGHRRCLSDAAGRIRWGRCRTRWRICCRAAAKNGHPLLGDLYGAGSRQVCDTHCITASSNLLGLASGKEPASRAAAARVLPPENRPTSATDRAHGRAVCATCASSPPATAAASPLQLLRKLSRMIQNRPPFLIDDRKKLMPRDLGSPSGALSPQATEKALQPRFRRLPLRLPLALTSPEAEIPKVIKQCKNEAAG